MSSRRNSTEIKGSLAEYPYVRLLADLYFDKCTGYLDIESESTLKIQFLSGFIEFVQSDEPDLLLGNLLVTKDLITEDEQKEIIDFSEDNGIRIGQASIQMGKLSPQELSYMLDLQMKLKLFKGFGIKEGIYRFSYTDGVDTNACFHINPIQILYDAVDSGIFPGKNETFELKAGSMVYPSDKFSKISDIKFSSVKHRKLVDMMAEPVSLKQLLSESPVDRQDTVKLIRLFNIARFIKIEPGN